MFYLNELGHPIVLIYLVVINLLTFLAYGMDKASAKAGKWRTREVTLWGMALAGGTLGALFGMHFFRHKTQKLPFQLMLAVIMLVQVMLVYLYFFATNLVQPVVEIQPLIY